MSPNAFVPQNAPAEAIHNSGELRNYALIPAKGPVSRDTARLLTQGYYACISYTDAQIGKLLDALERLKLKDNTIVILWGDHGWNLEDHTMWCKHANFESSMRAPLIISAPGYLKKQETRALTEFVDVYPTLCELANLSKPNHLDGESLVPLLENPHQNFKEAIFSRFHKGESIKTDQFVYTEWIDPENGAVIAKMLYDHAKDSLENINVVMDSAYLTTQQVLSAQLLERRQLSEGKTMLN
ncbi:MAG: sulfatase-like hydrolase/transferase [Saprospiraceae bacterium]|nr:sulfatase-like hydrolase/transferase [Saprospiraceae bacterium]